jgi:hypothetical protein
MQFLSDLGDITAVAWVYVNNRQRNAHHASYCVGGLTANHTSAVVLGEEVRVAMRPLAVLAVGADTEQRDAELV